MNAPTGARAETIWSRRSCASRASLRLDWHACMFLKLGPSPRLRLVTRCAFDELNSLRIRTRLVVQRHFPFRDPPPESYTYYWRRCFRVATEANMTDMMKSSDFQAIRDSLQHTDEQRESIIKRSRDLQKLAKQSIFSLHRGEHIQADQRLKSAAAIAAELLPIVQEHPMLRLGSFSAGLEEFAEALVLRCFLLESRLLSFEEAAPADIEEYLGGVMDFTGELNRYAVARATQRDVAAVRRCRDLVDALMAEFLQFDFRNGSLRKKFDSVKYTLKKLENMLYELSLVEGGGRPVQPAQELKQEQDMGADEGA